jgi:2-haloalkanoic acid dehalogenase type II
VKQPFEIITFDCYGTLIDWERGISEAFLEAAAADGVTLDRKMVLAAYEQVEPLVEGEQYRSYREVLTETASRVAHMLGWPVAYERAIFLHDSLPRWRPFPDTNPALGRLGGAGYRLGILSNTDDDLIAATRKHFAVDFELVITAQQVRSYKPNPAHWLAARKHIGATPWLHAAQSNLHDIVPTNVLGIPNAWINRRSDTALPGGTPSYELASMAAFAEAFAPSS